MANVLSSLIVLEKILRNKEGYIEVNLKIKENERHIKTVRIGTRYGYSLNGTSSKEEYLF